MGAVFQEVRPGAGFRTGDFVNEKLWPLLQNHSPAIRKCFSISLNYSPIVRRDAIFSHTVFHTIPDNRTFDYEMVLGQFSIFWPMCVCVFFTLNHSSTRRHPAHAVSVLILHPRKISSVVTSYDLYQVVYSNTKQGGKNTIIAKKLNKNT